uniref:Uncharacterized protein n=1 Tax=Poecilia latipinna TaxID=48699 RepID=A0A3B3UNL7_9TELE
MRSVILFYAARVAESNIRRKGGGEKIASKSSGRVRLIHAARLTSRCSRVKTTGSATNTRLDSFVMEADRMWELTVRERLCLFRSPIPLSVAFSVLRNWPRCL